MYNEYYDDPGLPSKQQELLQSLCGRIVTKMERFSTFAPYSSENSEIWKTPPEQYFSLGGGPVLVTLDSGLAVRIGSDPALISVELYIEIDEFGKEVLSYPLSKDVESFRTEAIDPVYSNDRMRSFLAKRIKTFRLLQIAPQNEKCEDRPREAGLVMVMEDDMELLFSHGLHDGSDDFSVITMDMIDSSLISKLKEIPLIVLLGSQNVVPTKNDAE